MPSSYLKMQLYFDQINRQNAAQRNAILGEARTLANQSNKTIEQCQNGLSKLRTDSAYAGGKVQNGEKSLAETESQLRTARKRRADQDPSVNASRLA